MKHLLLMISTLLTTGGCGSSNEPEGKPVSVADGFFVVIDNESISFNERRLPFPVELSRMTQLLGLATRIEGEPDERTLYWDNHGFYALQSGKDRPLTLFAFVFPNGTDVFEPQTRFRGRIQVGDCNISSTTTAAELEACGFEADSIIEGGFERKMGENRIAIETGERVHILAFGTSEQL